MAKKKPPAPDLPRWIYGPSGRTEAVIDRCRHCGARMRYRRDKGELRHFVEVAPRHRCPGRDHEDQQWALQRQREAAIDAIIQPIIDDRLRRLTGPAGAAANVPQTVYSDTVAPMVDEETRRELKAAQADRRRIIRQILFRALERITTLVPSVTREEIVAYITASLPTTGRGRPALPFDPALVEQAHAALLKARPDWDCQAACRALALRLHVSPRKIQELRARHSWQTK